MKTLAAKISILVLISVCLAFAAVVCSAESGSADKPAAAATGFYAPVLEQYRTAINEHWDYEMLDDKGLCCLPALIDNAADKIGFGFLKLDPDSPDCLVIAFIPEKEDVKRQYELLSVYALGADKKPVLLLNGAERDSFILCGNPKDGFTLAETGSNGAAETDFIFWKVNGTKLVPVETIVYSGSADEKNPWFHAKDTDETDPAKMEHISEKDAQAVIDSYKPCTEDIDLTPLSYYPAP